MTGFDAAPTSNVLTRRILLDGAIACQKLVDRVDVREISLPADLEVGAHRRPCPVFGHVIAGPILFQIRAGHAACLQLQMLASSARLIQPGTCWLCAAVSECKGTDFGNS